MTPKYIKFAPEDVVVHWGDGEPELDPAKSWVKIPRELVAETRMVFTASGDRECVVPTVGLADHLRSVA